MGLVMQTEVEEPSSFGVIISDENSYITRFVEKPKEYVGNTINSGIYILNKEILKFIPENTFYSLEKDVFEKLCLQNNKIGKSQLICKTINGYWKDLGKPFELLEGTK